MSWAVAAAVLISAVVPLSAQLGEVARKEAERRKAVKSSGKTYTNDNLPAAPQPSSAPASSHSDSPDTAPAPPPPSSSSAPVEAPAPRVSSDPEERKKEEAMWRDRIKAEREALERAKTFADALQSKINALETDFVNRDDPVQRDGIAAEREKSLAEQARLKKEIEQHTNAIVKIQEEARRAGAPAGWVR